MKGRLLLIGLASLAMLACCGKKAGGADAASGEIAAALDTCAAGRFGQTVCANRTLADLNGSIRQTLTAEAATISDAGAQMLAQSQQRWVEAQRIACGVQDAAATLTADQTRCLESALRARAREATTAVQRVGGYTFQTVEIAGASPVTQEAADAVGLGPDAPAAIVRDIRFPRIDAAANDPNAQRFIQLVAQQPQFAPEDQTEVQVRYC
ncbi:MAG: hypothetical protein AB7L65_03735, partial [Hyphomonadaceae bacterium]